MAIEQKLLKNIIETSLLVNGKPQSIKQLLVLFENHEDSADKEQIEKALELLMIDYADRGIELTEVANGFRIQARKEMEPWISKMFQEKPPRYSRALLETLVLIAYRQPVTRSEIEQVRGVGVSTFIMKTLLEREWVRIVGHREVPGRPAIYATTKEFLDYFNIKGIEELPALSEIKDLDKHPQVLELSAVGVADESDITEALLNQEQDTGIESVSIIEESSQVTEQNNLQATDTSNNTQNEKHSSAETSIVEFVENESATGLSESVQ